MLPEIAVEVLHFLSRRDLDKACAVSKWLDALIAKTCNVYPLRPVTSVELLPSNNGSNPAVTIRRNSLQTSHSFCTTDEALTFTCSVLRLSYVKLLKLGEFNHSRMNLSQDRWTTLIDAIRSGVVECLRCTRVDFSELDFDAFLIAVGLRGLDTLQLQGIVVPSGFVTDDLIRCSAAKGLLGLTLWDNVSDTPHGFSDEAVLDFFFRADPAPEGQRLDVTLFCPGVTEMFLSKFFERLRQSPVLPGSLEFYGDTPEQRGLSAYTQYLVSSEDDDEVYRFPTSSDSDKSDYEITRIDSDDCMSMYIRKVHRPS